LVIHPTDPHIMYAESQHLNISKSVDGGNSWTSGTVGLSGSTPFVGVLTMDPNDPNRLFTGSTTVFRTTNALTTPWATSSQDLGSKVSAIAVAASDSNRVYVGTG